MYEIDRFPEHVRRALLLLLFGWYTFFVVIIFDFITNAVRTTDFLLDTTVLL